MPNIESSTPIKIILIVGSHYIFKQSDSSSNIL